MKCVIVDDESFAIELLSKYINLFPELDLVNTFTNPIKALIELSNIEELDILFLDIDMPEISGIQLASKLRKNFRYIIFTTAFSKYAVNAFGVKAFDYLLKPIEKVRFFETIDAVLKQEKLQLITPNKNILIVKNNVKGKFTSIHLNELVLVYIVGHKLHLITTNGNFETTGTIKNIAEYLSKDSRFMRVHHANIINLEKISSIEGNQIYMNNKFVIPISERYKPLLIQFINENSSSTKRS